MTYFNKSHTLKMTVYIIVFLSFSSIFYFLFLASVISYYQNVKKSEVLAWVALNQKKLLATDDIHTQHTLQTWKQQYPNFYTAIESHPTFDQLLQLATNIAEKSGFSVIEAAPIISQKNNTPFSTNEIHLQLSGNYQNLFYFIDQLDQIAWPYTLIELKIPHANLFDMQLKVPT